MEQENYIQDMIYDIDPRFGALIFDNIPHGIFTVDSAGRITSFNRAASKITGWERDQVVGRPFREILRSNHCEGACFLRNSIEGDVQHRDQEVEIIRRDGSELRVAVSTASP